MSGLAVIYVRVSSTDQAEGYSLEVQERDCRYYCDQHNLTVDRVFIEAGESAKTANRRQFQALFAYVAQKQNRARVTHVVVDRLDRFSRNVDDGAIYRSKLSSWGIKLRSVKEQIDETPIGKYMTSVFSANAQLDNDMRRIHTGSGMRAAVEGGRWCWPSPLGYLPGKGKNQPSLIHDPDRAPLVAELFTKVADGQNLMDAVEWARVIGLRGRRGSELTTSTASRLLRNPIYKGRLEVPNWGVSREGDFAAIVTPELWARVQVVLNGNAEAVMVPHTKVNESYPLRGVIVCDTCGKLATASTSKGRSAKFAYYHCARGIGHLSMRVDKAESAFIEVLERLAPNQSRMKVVEEVFRDVWNRKNASSQSDRERLESRFTTLTTRKRRVLDQMQDGVLLDDDFRALYESLNAQIAETETELNNVRANGPELDVDTAFGYLSHLVWNQHIFYQDSNLEGKRRVAGTIFPSGLRCSKAGFGTAVTHSLFSVLADESVSSERLVALTGIEPVF